MRNGKSRSAGPVVADRQLVERCLAGEVQAWSQLYHHAHDSLLNSIRRFLGRAGQDTDLTEEIAARVWYSLVKDGFELLAKFDVSRGCRLSTFLSILAKSETRGLMRTERRRKSREQVASRPEAHLTHLGQQVDVLSDEEFLAILSPAERTFYCDVLIADPSRGEMFQQKYSTENLWQLRHRIRKKLEQFLLEAAEPA